MAFSWHADVLVRVRAPLTDDAYGNPERDWDAALRTALPGWRVQPVQGSRVTAAQTIPREGLERKRRAFGPYDADVLTTDRIEFDGVTWTIDADVDRWRSPTGRLAHTEIMLTRMEG